MRHDLIGRREETVRIVVSAHSESRRVLLEIFSLRLQKQFDRLVRRGSVEKAKGIVEGRRVRVEREKGGVTDGESDGVERTRKVECAIIRNDGVVAREESRVTDREGGGGEDSVDEIDVVQSQT